MLKCYWLCKCSKFIEIHINKVFFYCRAKTSWWSVGSSIFNMIAVFFPSSFLLTLHCSFHMNCAFWKQIENMPSARYILLRKNHCICFVTLKIFYFAGMRYFDCRRFISFWICWVFITSNGSSFFCATLRCSIWVALSELSKS